MSQSPKKTQAQTIDMSELDQSSKAQTMPKQHPAPSSADPPMPNVRPSKILDEVAERRAATATPQSGNRASNEQGIRSIPPEAPVAKASHPLPSPAQINAYAISQLTNRPLRRGGKLYNGRLPENYRSVARRVTYVIVALPIAIVTSYVLFERLVMGQERKRPVPPPPDIKAVQVQQPIEFHHALRSSKTLLMVALSKTAKRKKTADMEESPPKRMTRARAKATEHTKSIAKTTKITTAAAKAAAENKSKTTKRKTRADDVQVQAEASSGPTPNPKAEPAKTRARPKMTVESSTAESTDEKAQPRTKRHQEKDVPIPASAQIERPKTRGRPKKETLGATADPHEMVARDGKPENQSTFTRGRAATTISRSTRTTALKPSTMRKKVTFHVESEQDKENISAVQRQKAKAESKPTGLRAKPLRKPAQPRTSARGKGRTTGEVNETGEKQETQPLSPKKVKQVAKSSSVSSEDELCGEKTPVRALSKSPTKPAVSVMRSSIKPVSRLDFSAAAVPLSPTKPMSSTILTSPARRPPTSLFKDALKESPKRINLGESIAQPVLKASNSPMKVSLLQSPARRPASSPTKAAAPSSPGKSTMSITASDATTPTRKLNPIRKPMFSPQKVTSSPLRAARSPEQPVKIHKMSLAEQEGQEITPKPLTIDDRAVSKDVEENTPDRPVSENIPGSATKTPKPELMLQSPPTSPTECVEEIEDKVNHAAASKPQVNSVLSTRSTTPSEPPPLSIVKAYNLSSQAWRSSCDDSESEDELQSPQKDNTPTPLCNFGISTKDFGITGASTPSIPSKTPKSVLKHVGADNEAPASTKSRFRASQKSVVSMTPLAVQLSSWLATSPEKDTPANEVRRPHGIFSPIGPTLLSRPDEKFEDAPAMSPMKPTFFEDEMAVRDEQNEAESEDLLEEGKENRMDIQLSQDSQDSEEYGDENAMPLDPELLGQEEKTQDYTLTCTPAKVFNKQPREIHTVSKVPLRPAAEESPLKISRQRSKSLSSSIAVGKRSQRATSVGISKVHEATTAGMLPNEYSVGECATPSRPTVAAPQTPGSGAWSIDGTPARSNRQGPDAEILKGAVVYVDVHTTEGADASGIFLELLTQMGARCVKQWTWNPRASFGGSLEGTGSGQPESLDPSHESATPGSKVGITHVVFKDGGKRTLEKVRESKGVVLCVGVGWVLDCERENKWLDEADYAVDTSTIPRGGHRRRKSMEPRLLANINGSLIPADTPAKQHPDLSPTKEFLTFSSPASRRDSFAIPNALSPEALPLPQTPAADDDHEHNFDDDDSAWGSPTTPYYLSRGAELVQQTCPPKQSLQLLFPLSGQIEDQPDETVRRRLLLARRKSLQWAPKVGSPLGRAVDYGK